MKPGQKLEMNDFVAPHVQVWEIACRCGCGFGTHFGDIDETVIADFEEIRARCGGESITINSGCRCRKHNEAIGGSPNSAHVEGKALDLSPPYGIGGFPERPEFVKICEEIVKDGGVGSKDYEKTGGVGSKDYEKTGGVGSKDYQKNGGKTGIVHIDCRTKPPKRRW